MRQLGDLSERRTRESRPANAGSILTRWACTLIGTAEYAVDSGSAVPCFGRLFGVPAETHVNQGPIERDEIFEIVRDRLADILEIDPASISEGQSFADDLEADSLALIELVESLEEELSDRTVGFRIEDEDLEDLKTVRDAVDYVHARTGS